MQPTVTDLVDPTQFGADIEQGDILAVDDTLVNLHVLTNLLKSRGHKVRPVSSGKMALQVIEAVPPEVILLDINMPEMNGFEVCRQLKEHPRHRDIPVIFLTAMNEREDRLRAFREGGVDYITKPFDAEEVLMRVRTHLAMHRMRESLRRQNAVLEAANRRIKLELEAALAMKRSLMPASYMETENARVCCACLPGDDVSGELMNMVHVDDRYIAAYVVDTKARGAMAAMQAATLSKKVNEAGLPAEHAVVSPAKVLADVENACADNPGLDQATLVYCLYDTKTHEVRYVTAGHPWPLLVNADRPGLEQNDKGQPLGEHAPRIEKTTALKPGDRLYMFSDSLALAKDTHGEGFGRARLRRYAFEDRNLPLREAVDRMVHRVSDWVRPAQLPADLSLMAIEAVK